MHGKSPTVSDAWSCVRFSFSVQGSKKQFARRIFQCIRCHLHVHVRFFFHVPLWQITYQKSITCSANLCRSTNRESDFTVKCFTAYGHDTGTVHYYYYNPKLSIPFSSVLTCGLLGPGTCIQAYYVHRQG